MPAHLTYSSYLCLDAILNAQHPKSDPPEHDETLFIIIHQVYELWFKQILHEFDHLQRLLHSHDRPNAQQTLKCILTILKTVVSYQFREIEFALGRKHSHLLNHFSGHETAQAHLRARYEQPTVWDAFIGHLAASGCSVPVEILTRPVESSPDMQAVLLDVYRHKPDLVPLCERLVDLDEGFQEWRYRHVKMVERTIGNKRGTGGSSGVDYLARTITPFFPDLWAIRTQL